MKSVDDLIKEGDALLAAGDRLRFLRPEESWSHYRDAALRFKTAAHKAERGPLTEVSQLKHDLSQ